ncbi:MAG TPA: hypothetical protein DC060_09490 [Gemmatimonadetes bacterium]|nr:hypothetical protein [Gemmatimonadota bacterium]HIN51248.1 FtsX-like permease family protein [Gemmatimonadota bacterium]
MIRGDGDALDLLPGVKSVLAEMDPLIPIARSRTLSDVRDESMAREQFVLMLLSIFGVVALLLATVGVYGVTAQAARRRTQEIGIRMALGAGAPEVLRMMLRHGLMVVGLGLGAGLAASLVAVIALLGGVALVACYIPARRATAVDPVTSLHVE